MLGAIVFHVGQLSICQIRKQHQRHYRTFPDHRCRQQQSRGLLVLRLEVCHSTMPIPRENWHLLAATRTRRNTCSHATTSALIKSIQLLTRCRKQLLKLPVRLHCNSELSKFKSILHFFLFFWVNENIILQSCTSGAEKNLGDHVFQYYQYAKELQFVIILM